MGQKYRVFIREGSIAFYDGRAEQVLGGQQVVENPKKDMLLGIIKRLEEGITTTDVHVVGDAEKNWQRFVKHFKVIEAAGGVVLNQQDDWLFIHRLGKWDLPKGKLEKGEKPKEAATREVSEECGIPEPTIIAHITDTYHVYPLNGKRILKRTYWYLMRSTAHTGLVAQAEEGITDVRWVNKFQVAVVAADSYGSIRQVIDRAFGVMGELSGRKEPNE